MSAPGGVLPNQGSWYAEGLRWVAARLYSAADRIDRWPSAPNSLDPMPRHTSFEEVVGDLRNRMHSGFGAGHRPYY